MSDIVKKATRESYGEELEKLGKENEKIVVLDADLSSATKTNIFAKSIAERFFNMGIAEQNMMSTAAGMATCGLVPYASTFAVFAAGRAYDQIRNSICYPNLNVKICATHAGVTVGEDGATHQMVEDIALMRTLPNMTVVCTSDDVQTRWAVREIAKIDGPVYLRLEIFFAVDHMLVSVLSVMGLTWQQVRQFRLVKGQMLLFLLQGLLLRRLLRLRRFWRMKV